MTQVISTPEQLKDFIKITLDFVGLPVESTFNHIFRNLHTRFSDDFSEYNLFADAVGHTSRYDIISSYNGYIVQPDIYIGRIFGLPVDEDQIDLMHKFRNDSIYKVILRRIGMPSVRYCIENNLDNVFVIPGLYLREYYSLMLAKYKFICLDTDPLTQDYVDEHYELFNILER